MKTSEQIQMELAALTRLQPNVRKFTAFGGNNHDALAAQIEVLRELFDIDEVIARYEEQGEHVYSAAMEASDWLFDRLAEETPSLASDWATVCVRTEAFDPYSGR